MSSTGECDMNVAHICNFKPVREHANLFVCMGCKTVHKCGEGACENLQYNSDYTKVCTLTGLCFEQRICDAFIDTKRPIDGDDPIYVKRVKRDQQIKNKMLERQQVMKIIECASPIVHIEKSKHEKLCSKIMNLWDYFVDHITDKKEYVHRKDKRCFVVAIVMSLKKGIMTDDEKFIVMPHAGIKSEKLNKKSEYSEFCVSDIRYGQTLIKRIFNGASIGPAHTVCI